MIALGKAKKPGLAAMDEPSEDDVSMSDEDIDIDEDEMAAAKMAFDAKSPEEYAKALKAFVHLCYSQHESSEEEY